MYTGVVSDAIGEQIKWTHSGRSRGSGHNQGAVEAYAINIMVPEMRVYRLCTER